MSKTKELTTVIAPGVAAGLLALYATGAITAGCLANAAAGAVALLGAIGVCAAAVDFERRMRRPAVNL